MVRHRRALRMLATEIAVLWGADSCGAKPMPPVVIAQAGCTYRVHLSPELPAATAARARALAAGFGGAGPVSLLDQLGHFLFPVTGPLRVQVGLSYDCAQPVAVPPFSGAWLITADNTDLQSLQILQMASEWGGPAAWRQLLDNGLPWAAVSDGRQVLAVCESARWSPHGAEAGTWTLPAARGCGLAAAVTANWAAQCRGQVPHVFYSTSAENRSSQRVAERLGLPLIGKLWQAVPTTEPVSHS